jgi:outer membrane protein assembly factor BamA
VVLDIYALKKIQKNLFSGLNMKYTAYSAVKPGNNRIIYPELTGSSTFGIGYSLVYDSRNNILTPSSGCYFNFNTSYNLSEMNYLKTTLDLRYYKTWKEKLTLSARFINELTTGTAPFYDYAFLGGDKFVRGYYFGRYRDKNLSSLQSEIRFPIVWRFGLAAFGGLSTLYANTNSIAAKNIKPNYGMGLRFLVDKKDKTNLRLDYAAGKDGNNGFYVSFGESF